MGAVSVKHRKLEGAALILMAFLVWGPFCATLTGGVRPLANPGGNRPEDKRGSDWTRIFVRSSATDWLLVIVGGFQVGLLFAQARIAHRQSDAADLQNEISLQQMDILVKQKEIARQGHLVAHRPRIVIRHVWMEGQSGRILGEPRMTVTESNPLVGSAIIVNVGGSDAIIRHSAYRVCMLKGGESLPAGAYIDGDKLTRLGAPEKQLVSFSDPSGVSETLAPGQSLTVPVEGVVTFDRSTGNPSTDEFIRSGYRIFIMGDIMYEDWLGNSRFVGFCRWSDLSSGFRPVQDPDYEYQD
jgi:hypothetical protein